jgi:hypothetical protein
LSDSGKDDSDKKVPYENEALLNRGRVDELERQQVADKDNEKNYKNRQLSFNGRLVGLTLALVITSAIADGISIWEGRIANRASNAATSAAQTAHQSLTSSNEFASHTLAEMQKQSKAMQDAANAATSQVAISRQSLDASNRENEKALDATIASSNLDQRAWVSVDVGEKTGNFAVTMRNTGRTPAINAAEVTAFSGGTGIAPPEVDFSRNSSSPLPIPKNLPPDILEKMKREGYIRDKPPTGYVIAPGDTQIASDYQGKFGQLFKIEGNRAYVQGRVTYDDVFGRSHETIFCFWFAPPSDFVMCNDHNKMN